MESWSMNENINGYFKVSKKDLCRQLFLLELTREKTVNMIESFLKERIETFGNIKFKTPVIVKCFNRGYDFQVTEVVSGKIEGMGSMFVLLSVILPRKKVATKTGNPNRHCIGEARSINVIARNIRNFSTERTTNCPRTPISVMRCWQPVLRQ